MRSDKIVAKVPLLAPGEEHVREIVVFFFSSRRRHTRLQGDWSSDVCCSDLKAVILLHGISDSRLGVAGYGQMFLQHGYRILLPDSRAHGESGGDIATYGLRESDDVHRWVSWLYDRGVSCVDGFGESMGAALVLESMSAEPGFCSVVADSP